MKAKHQPIANKLNEVLADLQMYYQNLRGLHWNIRGPHFFGLHAAFEKWYDEAAADADETAERILSLGFEPLHDWDAYKGKTRIPVLKNITDAREAMTGVERMLDTLIERFGETLAEANTHDDEGTSALMSDLISRYEKNRWMVRAWLG